MRRAEKRVFQSLTGYDRMQTNENNLRAFEYKYCQLFLSIRNLPHSILY